MEINGQIWILYHSQLKKQTKPLSTVHMQKLLLSLKLKDINDFYIWTPGWPEWQSIVNFIKSPQTFFILTGIPALPKIKQDEDIPIVDVINEESRSKINPKEIYNEHETKEFFVDKEEDNLYTLVNTEKNNSKSVEEYGYFSGDFRAEDIDVNAAPSLKDKFELTGASPDTDTGTGDRRIADRLNFRLEVILISKTGKMFKTFSKNISLGGTLLENPVPKDFLNGDFEMMLTNRFEADKNKGRLHFRGKIVGDIKNPQRLTFKEGNDSMMAKLEVMLKAYVAQQKAMIQERRVK